MGPTDEAKAARAVAIIQATHGKLLTIGVGNLINRLAIDLQYGPAYVVQSPVWPFEMLAASWGDEGATPCDFGTGCTELDDYLACIGTQWYNDFDGEWLDYEPTGYWENLETGDISYEEPDGDLWEYVEPTWTDWYIVNETDFKRALLGELAEYV